MRICGILLIETALLLFMFSGFRERREKLNMIIELKNIFINLKISIDKYRLTLDEILIKFQYLVKYNEELKHKITLINIKLVDKQNTDLVLEWEDILNFIIGNYNLGVEVTNEILILKDIWNIYDKNTQVDLINSIIIKLEKEALDMNTKYKEKNLLYLKIVVALCLVIFILNF